jgi:hypothetical protein
MDENEDINAEKIKKIIDDAYNRRSRLEEMYSEVSINDSEEAVNNLYAEVLECDSNINLKDSLIVYNKLKEITVGCISRMDCNSESQVSFYLNFLKMFIIISNRLSILSRLSVKEYSLAYKWLIEDYCKSYINSTKTYKVLVLDIILSGALDFLEQKNLLYADEYLSFFIYFHRKKLEYVKGDLMTYLDYLERYKSKEGNIQLEDMKFIDGNIDRLVNENDFDVDKKTIIRKFRKIYPSSKTLDILDKENYKLIWQTPDWIKKLKHQDYDTEYIKKLINQHETAHIQFKLTLPNPENLIKTVISKVHNGPFTGGYEGGVIFIGIEDETRKLEGVNENDYSKMRDRVENMLQNIKITPYMNLIKIDGVNLVMIVIDEKPRLIDYKGKYYVHVGSSSVEANGEQLKQIINWINQYE